MPLIVNVPPEKLPVTPAGKPVTPAPVPPPDTEYVIFVIAVPTHFVCAFVPPADVNAIAAFGFTRMALVAATLGVPPLYAIKLTMKLPTVLNVGVTVVVDVDVPGVPPPIVHRTESGLPLEAVDVFVNVKVPPKHTTVSLAVKLAVAVGEVTILKF